MGKVKDGVEESLQCLGKSWTPIRRVTISNYKSEKTEAAEFEKEDEDDCVRMIQQYSYNHLPIREN